MSEPDWLRRLYSLRRFGREPSLDGMRRLLSSLGNPQEEYEKVHIAGTKGKGSVGAMVHSVQRLSCRAGLYTSPHISRFTERIVVDGEEISMDVAEVLANEVMEAARRISYDPIFFEVATAMAFLHFQRSGVNSAAVEVGLGGRLDSTNVITPVVSVITRVGFDHVDRLGTTLRDIAREKAGIVKPGVPVVLGPNSREVIETVRNEALKRDAPLHYVGNECVVHAWSTGVDGTEVECTCERTYRVRIPVVGVHQVENALVAVRTLELLGAGKAEIERGLMRLRIRGRFEVVSRAPLIVVDGAHNPDSFRALVNTWKHLGLPRPSVVFATLQDKNYEANLRILSSIGETFHLPPLRSERGAPPERIAEIVRKHSKRAHVHGSVKDALDAAMEHPPVLVCGSFHLLGEVKRCLEM